MLANISVHAKIQPFAQKILYNSLFDCPISVGVIEKMQSYIVLTKIKKIGQNMA
jgi:hypothetical protein